MIHSAKLTKSEVVRRCGLLNVEKALEMNRAGNPWGVIKHETGLNRRHLISILPLKPKRITNRLSDVTIGKIIQMRREGLSYPEIAKATEVGIQTPRKICRKAFDDIELERIRSLAARRRRGLLEISSENALKYTRILDLRSQGLSYSKIGDSVMMSPQGVMSVIFLHMPIEIEEVISENNKLSSRFQLGVDLRRIHKEKCPCPVCRIEKRKRTE